MIKIHSHSDWNQGSDKVTRRSIAKSQIHNSYCMWMNCIHFNYMYIVFFYLVCFNWAFSYTQTWKITCQEEYDFSSVSNKFIGYMRFVHCSRVDSQLETFWTELSHHRSFGNPTQPWRRTHCRLWISCNCFTFVLVKKDQTIASAITCFSQCMSHFGSVWQTHMPSVKLFMYCGRETPCSASFPVISSFSCMLPSDHSCVALYLFIQVRDSERGRNVLLDVWRCCVCWEWQGCLVHFNCIYISLCSGL